MTKGKVINDQTWSRNQTIKNKYRKVRTEKQRN